MKIKMAWCLIIGSLACARGEASNTPKNECFSSADCVAGDTCHYQDCVNGQCVDIWKDDDHDGAIDLMCGAIGKDCNDTDPSIGPQMPEVCDCLDNNCDKSIDDGCNYQMQVLDKSTGAFGCFASKSFRQVEMPSSDPSHEAKPRHNTVFINALNEGWGSATVWYYGRDGKRYIFPGENIFESWFGAGADKCCLVRTVSNEMFNSIPTAFVTDDQGDIHGGKVCFRPDAKIWQVDPPEPYDYALFVVAHNCVVRQLASETVAEEIFGPDWENLLDSMPYALFKTYSHGAIIESRMDFDLFLEQSRSMTIDNNQDL